MPTRSIAALVCIMAFGCRQTEPADSSGLPSSESAPTSSAAAIYLDDLVATGVLPGATLVVATDSQVLLQHTAGWTEVESRHELTDDAIFRIASMTKPITTVGLLMLVEEGRIGLDDPVEQYLPSFAAIEVLQADGTPDPARETMTVRHLLTHEAGLASWSSGPTTEAYYELSDAARTTEELADGLAAIPLSFEPGTQWDYGTAHEVVGRLIEVVSGEGLDDFFEIRIFAPLGMVDTYFYVPAEKLDRLTATYRPDDDGSLTQMSPLATPPQGSTEVFFGGGGLRTTAADYLRFCRLLLGQGSFAGATLLTAESVELMTNDHVGRLYPRSDEGYGWGFGVRVLTSEASDSPRSPGAFGWNGQFSTAFVVDPEQGLILILLTHVLPSRDADIFAELQRLVAQSEPSAPARRLSQS